jgi:hypothetical protein
MEIVGKMIWKLMVKANWIRARIAGLSVIVVRCPSGVADTSQ